MRGSDTVILTTDTERYLYRLKEEIPVIDSTHLDSWLSDYEAAFRKRANNTPKCPDLRTEEEKSPPLGTVEDDFEEIIGE